ncbi:cholesterol oxidase substrate-binding domain-containing protein [Streptomyces capparidis]
MPCDPARRLPRAPGRPALPGAPRPTRRALLAAAATAWIPAYRLPAGAAAGTLAVPPGFPAGIPLAQQVFRNWSLETVVEGVWTATARTPGDVLAVADWARAAGYRVRARGRAHNWSPLTLPAGADPTGTVLVDTTTHLTGVTVSGGDPATVTAQAGATVETVLTRLEQEGYGLAATTAPGDLTVGGALAVGAHGTGVPTASERPPAGSGFGTLGDLVTSLTAVVWDPAAGRHALRTFTRGEPDTAAFLVHLGRAFVTEVTLRAAANRRLRCRSWFDVPVESVFAAPGGGGRTLASHLDATGRVEAIWFPFTTVPWLKVWSLAPTRPAGARQLDRPYPYAFANRVTEEMSDLLTGIVSGDTRRTPEFANLAMALVGSGLITTGTWDVWGWSKNSLLYVEPTTLRIHEGGWAVLTARSSAQRVLHEFWTEYTRLLRAHRDRGSFPVNGPIEIRISGVDGAGGHGPPALLSPARPRADRPEWDTVVWIDFATAPGTPGAAPFFAELERWIVGRYTGGYAAVRPEWSKGWAYTGAGPWTDTAALSGWIPDAFDGWATARAVLDRHDPAGVFGNAFLDRLLGRPAPARGAAYPSSAG